jgi:mannose-6-phosphate isomerase-like protein (cupin superfamily)
MTQSQPIDQAGEHFKAVDLGAFAELQQFVFAPEGIPLKVEGKVFLKQQLNLTGAEISINTLPPRQSIPFFHKHRLNEEVYIFIQGQGEFQVDDRTFPIQEGSVVKVDPEGERCFHNTSETEDLCWIVVQSRVNSHPDNTIQDGYAVKRRVQWGTIETKKPIAQ